MLERLHTSYGVKRFGVTENGAASRADEAVVDGAVRDPVRVAFLRDHLQQVVLARRRGIWNPNLAAVSAKTAAEG